MTQFFKRSSETIIYPRNIKIVQPFLSTVETQCIHVYKKVTFEVMYLHNTRRFVIFQMISVTVRN